MVVRWNVERVASISIEHRGPAVRGSVRANHHRVLGDLQQFVLGKVVEEVRLIGLMRWITHYALMYGCFE